MEYIKENQKVLLVYNTTEGKVDKMKTEMEKTKACLIFQSPQNVLINEGESFSYHLQKVK